MSTKSKKKTIKLQPKVFDVTKFLEYKKAKNPFTVSQIKQVTKITVSSMIRSGKYSGEEIKQFVRVAAKAAKATSAKSLSKVGRENILNFLDYGKNKISKSGQKKVLFNQTKKTKATKFVEGQTIDKNVLKYLNQKGLLSKSDKQIVEFRKKQAGKVGRKSIGTKSTGRTVKQQKLWDVYNQSDVKDIIDSMGGFARAVQRYPEDVRRIINDYMGVDLEELGGEYEESIL